MIKHNNLTTKVIKIKFELILSIFVLFCLALGSCKTKEGCGLDEKVHVKLDRKGRKKGKTKSGLFPKKVNKRIRRGK